jgi:hypothetical protein
MYLLSNRFSRIIEQGLKGVETEIMKIPPSLPSRYIQDYMHLPEFEEILNKSKSIQEFMPVSPISLIGFTDENQEMILQALLHGAGVKNALAMTGVKIANYQLWVQLAERDIEPFATFILECAKAEAYLEVSLFQSMRAGGWKGAVELYKLRNPEVFYPGTHNTNNTANQVNINMNIMDKKPEERKALLEKYREEIVIDNNSSVVYEVREEDE